MAEETTPSRVGGARPFWRTLSFWLGIVTAASPGWKRLLWAIERAGDVDFLISFFSRFQAFFAAHWDLVLMVFGFALVARAIRQTQARLVTEDHGKPEVNVLTVAEESPPSFTEVAVRMAPEETVGRFREMYLSCCGPTIQYAYELLILLCQGHTDSEEQACIKHLVRAWVLPVCNKRKEGLDASLAEDRPLTETEFTERITLFEEALGDYIETIGEIKRVAPIILGSEEFSSSSERERLIRQHAWCLEEIRKAKSRSGLTKLAVNKLSILENLLPKSTSHPPSRFDMD